MFFLGLRQTNPIVNVEFPETILHQTAGLFDLNHDLNHSKKSLIYDIFLLPIFLIADLYEFNTNNCLQASRSTKFCMFLIQNTKCTHLCSCIVTR